MKVSGATYRLKTPVGTAFITINHDELGAPIELFINVGKAGSDVQAMAEGLGRLISKTLKMGHYQSTKERAQVVVGQLQGIGGSRSVGFGNQRITSLPDAVAKAIALDMGLMSEQQKAPLGKGSGNVKTAEQLSLSKREEMISKEQLELLARRADLCPSCGNATFVHEMGCATCHGCGYSEC